MVLLKHIDKINLPVRNADLILDYHMPDYTPLEYRCFRCGTMQILKKYRVLYCKYCKVGKIHPRYNFIKDCII